MGAVYGNIKQVGQSGTFMGSITSIIIIMYLTVLHVYYIYGFS